MFLSWIQDVNWMIQSRMLFRSVFLSSKNIILLLSLSIYLSTYMSIYQSISYVIFIYYIFTPLYLYLYWEHKKYFFKYYINDPFIVYFRKKVTPWRYLSWTEILMRPWRSPRGLLLSVFLSTRL